MAADRVKELELARDRLVAQRRIVATILTGSFKAPGSYEAVEDLLQLQAAIEAIDKARSDEHRLAGIAKRTPRPAPQAYGPASNDDQP